MYKNNVKLAFRTLKSHLGYTALNFVGLVIGLSACLLIVLYVAHERSFDGFHRQKAQLYRVNYDILMGGEQVISPSVPVFVAPELKERFPEVEAATRFSTEWRPRTMRYGDRMFDEPGFAYADPNFFDLFDFQALRGDLKTALARPNTLVLTESMARKYFGDTDPLGQIIRFNNKKDYEVAAVMGDVPANSHFSFQFLTSHYSLEDFAPSERNIQWNNPNYATWLLLKPGTDPAALAQKIEHWVHPPSEAGTGEEQNTLHLPLEPLAAVHFNTEAVNFANQMAITDPQYLAVFGSVAALILLIACVNYVNLATARASVRAKEVGVRKSIGATWRQLMGQFLGESFLLLLPAFLLSVGLAYLLLPALNGLLDTKIPFVLHQPAYMAGLGAGWVALSLLAGLYPALVLSRYRPIATLKGDYAQSGGTSLNLRKGLVVFQFVVSMLLIVGTIVVRSQLHYMQSEQLGLDKAQVVYLRGNADLREKISPFCAQLRGLSGVEEAAPAWRSPFETVIGNGFSLDPNPQNGSDWHIVGGVGADEHYLPTLGITLLAGRNFDPAKVKGDSTVNEFIVNEAFLKHYNLKVEEAIGRRSLLGNASQRGPGTIVGVVRDFHIASLRTEVGPIVLYNDPDAFGSALFRIGKGQDLRAVMAQVETTWKNTVPMRPFNPIFLDEQYDALFRTEQRMGALMSIFCGLAIVVACLGLFGLATFVAAQRTKEIGIRKVLGATVAGITGLLAQDFLKLVIVSVVIASPVAYWLMQKWLSDFAYRIDMHWWMFAVAGVAAVGIALLTVGFQSVRAALANPARSLKSE